MTVLNYVGIGAVVVMCGIGLALIPLVGVVIRSLNPATTGTTTTSSGHGVTVRGTIIWGPVWALFMICCMALALTVIDGCILPKFIDKGPAPPTVVASASTVSAATIPTSTPSLPAPAPTVGWQKTWVELMEEELKLQHMKNVKDPLLSDCRLEKLEPVWRTIVTPGEVKFTGQILDGKNIGHVRVSDALKESDLEFSCSVLQDKWWSFSNRFKADPENDLLLVRLKPGAAARGVTTRRLLPDDKDLRDDDKVMAPAVRMIYRNVPGPIVIKEKGKPDRVTFTMLKIANVLTSLPSHPRVESRALILLLGQNDRALPPTHGGSISVMRNDEDPKVPTTKVKFDSDDFTVGHDNPSLTVSPNVTGLYDIIVVLTPI